MKNKLIAAGIVTGALLLSPSHIFADSLSKVNTTFQYQIEENSVVGEITDADTFFAVVEYKDSTGNIQTLDIDFPNESNKTLAFNKGDKVKVINKDKWQVMDYGRHKVTFAPGDFVSKLIDDSKSQNTQAEENYVIGEITDADTFFAVVEYKDSTGNIQTLDIDFPNESNKTLAFNKGDKVKVTNKDKWEVRDFGYFKATIAPGDFVSKLTDDSKSQNTQAEENYVIGEITDADTFFAVVEYKDSTGNIQRLDIDFPNESNKTFAIGDKVKVTNKDKWEVRDFGYFKATIAPGDFVSKLTDDSKSQNTQAEENYVIGEITDADTFFAVVEYKDSTGNIQRLDIDFPNESNKTFAIGDKVKVTNKDKWEVRDFGYFKATIASGDFVTKLTDDSTSGN
ncbi:hypothetical protein [Paenibacillus thiaminolyticus]|uniref:hypothetical protein n=1 Tax=Paenibacillus thiaminolyticus TaxID=49283 RepID=UPI002543AA51|nr:hypothetical protein [Paenibacillus thiaminolyticus]WII35001.1 hypothetical protein O0V01_14815 [Paenibacillus thiaminolyticus]